MSPDVVRLERAGAHQVLTLSGVVGVLAAEAMLAAARQAAGAEADVIVACGAVEHLDTAAIQVLLALESSVQAHGHTVALEEAPAPLTAYLRFAGLTRWLAPPAVDAGSPSALGDS